MSKKLSSEDLLSITESKQEYDSLLFTIGQLTVDIDELQSKLEALIQDKNDHIQTYKTVLLRHNTLAKRLVDKYGEGQINLETGEII